MKYVMSSHYYDTLRESLGYKKGNIVIPATKEQVIAHLNETAGILGGISELVIQREGDKSGTNQW